MQIWLFGGTPRLEEVTSLRESRRPAGLMLVALGGEVVVDYSLRLKKALGHADTWVMGYANDVMAYIPSLRVLKEGGYEGGGAMVIYGQPTTWGHTVEETIIDGVMDLSRRCGSAK